MTAQQARERQGEKTQQPSQIKSSSLLRSNQAAFSDQIKQPSQIKSSSLLRSNQAAFSDQIFGIKNNCSTTSRKNFRTKKKNFFFFWGGSLFSLELRKLVSSRLNFGLVTLQTVTVYQTVTAYHEPSFTPCNITLTVYQTIRVYHKPSIHLVT